MQTNRKLAPAQPSNRSARRKAARRSRKRHPKGARVSSPRTLLAHRLTDAVRLAAQGQLKEAEAHFRSIAADHPDSADAHFNLAQLLQHRGEQDQAYQAYKKAVTLAPDKPLYWRRLGQCLTRLGYSAAAAVAFERAVTLRPDDAALHLSLAAARYRQGDHVAALAAATEALELKPDLSLAHLEKGNQYCALGDFEKGRESFRHAIHLNPRLVEAYHQLARMGEWAEDAGPILRKLDALSRLDELPIDARACAHFTMAYILDKRSDYNRAFESYRNANLLVGQCCDFDRLANTQLIEALIEAFRPEVFDRLSNAGSETQAPVFIIGMPRSGSTLVEQIISSHPAASAGGEFPRMGHLSRLLLSTRTESLNYPHDIGMMEAKNLLPLGEDYLSHLLRDRPPDTIRVTDKLLTNFLQLGLISILFPRAKIVHCKRDPLDTCLSCYFQRFAQAEQLAYSNDLKDLGFYYRQYERLMDHWRAVLPSPILDVRYEDLIGRQSEKSREIIDFVGLEWDDECLKFYENKNGVRTASMWQVRQPMYKSSIARWRCYEKHLGPLKDALAAPA